MYQHRRLPHAALVILATLGAITLVAGPADAATSAPQFASGSVASISGSSAEVQSAESGQETVSWTSATTFTERETLTVASVVVGDCVTVSGTPVKKKKATDTAQSVTIDKPSATGTCTTSSTTGGRGFFGGGRVRSGGAPGGGFGGGFGGGAPRQGGTGGGGGRAFSGRPGFSLANVTFTVGKVTKITSKGFVVKGINTNLATAAKKAKSAKNKQTKLKLKTTTTTLVTSSKTTVTETETVASSVLGVGDCVTAIGPASTTGAITASTISITSTTAGATCTGFGGGGFGFGGGGPGGGGPGGSAPGAAGA